MGSSLSTEDLKDFGYDVEEDLRINGKYVLMMLGSSIMFCYLLYLYYE